MVRFSLLDRETSRRLVRAALMATLASMTVAWSLSARAGDAWLVQDLNTYEPTRQYPSFSYDHPVYVNGKLFVSASGYMLHVYDGNSTQPVSLGVPPGDPNRIQNIIAWKNEAWLSVIDSQTKSGLIWKSDGTAAGTNSIETPDGYRILDSMVACGEWIYFYGLRGKEGLIRTDGTGEGNLLLNDRLILKKDTKLIDPQPLRLMTAVNGDLFFMTQLEGNQKGVWRTDGTESGTLLLQSFDRANSSDKEAAEIADVGGVAYISLYEGSGIDGLWKSDGTTQGTVRVKAVKASHLTKVGGNSLFFVGYDTEHGYELWKSDGTSEGTVLVKDIRPGIDTSFLLSSVDGGPLFTDVNGTLFFMADDGVRGQELWKSDGTAEGTMLVKDIRPSGQNFSSPDPVALFNANGTLYFFGSENSEGGFSSLWKSDGTSEGTVMISTVDPTYFDNRPDNGFAGISWYENVNFCLGPGGYLYFNGFDSLNGHEMWRTDGTPEGTERVTDYRWYDSSSIPKPVIRAFDTYLFAASEGQDNWFDYDPELWRIDGPRSCTKLAASFLPLGKKLRVTHQLVNGLLFIVGNNTSSPNMYGDEFSLWVTDGTLAGTQKIQDRIDILRDTILVGEYFYYINAGLWRTDGSAGGTVLVHPAARSGLGYDNGCIYFGGGLEGIGPGLWKSDGTTSGTMLVKAIPSSNYYKFRAGFKGNVYFYPNDQNFQLWISDGTESGTQLYDSTLTSPSPAAVALELNDELLFLYGAPSPVISKTRGGTAPLEVVVEIPNAFIRHRVLMENKTELFSVSYNSNEYDLWRTDGTSTGTYALLSNISTQYYPGLHGSLLFANRKIESTSPLLISATLNVTDGTSTGTRPLASVKGQNPFLVNAWLISDMIYFVFEDEAVYGAELWRSDGTPEGTFLLADINPGSGGSFPSELVEMDGLVYFTTRYQPAGGDKLWRTDGTPEGTRPALDSDPSLSPSGPSHLTLIDGRLYFSASDSEHGIELWRTDGTLAGTERLTDIAPGRSSSNPTSFMPLGNILYFSATDNSPIGMELYAIQISNATEPAWRLYP